ncbi:MAG: hypothetical protein AAGC55_13840 [Myxococcota bacterium]
MLAVLAVPATAVAQAPGFSGGTQEVAPEDMEPSADNPDAGTRDGWSFGLTVGRGSIEISCSACDVAPLTEALSMTVHVGRMITPRLALGIEHWTVRYNDRGSEWFDDSAEHLVAQRISTLSAQLWLSKHLWVRGGAGIGRHIGDSRYVRTDYNRIMSTNPNARSSVPVEDMGEPVNSYSPALVAAIGFEFARRTDMAVDLQLRIGTTRRSSEQFQVHNTGFVVGVNWY